MNPRYQRVAGRAMHRFEYCGAPESVFNFAFEIEHIIPFAAGGDDDDSNLALACRSCNVHIGSGTRGVDSITGATTDLFHPRQQDWHAHFRAHPATGHVIGLTAVGRTTAVQLHMNSDAQISARLLWLRLGLFP